MDAAGLDALVRLYPARIAYLTGFHHVPTGTANRAGFRAQRLLGAGRAGGREEHAESGGRDRPRRGLLQYPAPSIRWIASPDAVGDQRETRRTGADHDGFVPYCYRGPRLSDLTGTRPVDGEMLVESLRRVSRRPRSHASSSAAIGGSRPPAYADAITQARLRMECYVPSATETLFEMVHEMPGWRPRATEEAAHIDVRGRRSTAMPHGFVKATASEGGHPGEWRERGHRRLSQRAERTMIVGEPNREQERAFAAMLALVASHRGRAPASRPARSSWPPWRSRPARRVGQSCATVGHSSASKAMRRPSSTAATRRCWSQAWCSPSSRAST